MTQLMLRQSEKLRERMSEIKDADHDHTAWVSPMFTGIAFVAEHLLTY